MMLKMVITESVMLTTTTAVVSLMPPPGRSGGGDLGGTGGLGEGGGGINGGLGEKGGRVGGGGGGMDGGGRGGLTNVGELTETVTEGRRLAICSVTAVLFAKALATSLVSALPGATTVVVDVSAVFSALIMLAPIDVSAEPTWSTRELFTRVLVPTLYSRDTKRPAVVDSRRTRRRELSCTTHTPSMPLHAAS